MDKTKSPLSLKDAWYSEEDKTSHIEINGKASSSLIAAAPEMLEVLERVDKHFKIIAVGSLHDPNVNALRDAIEWAIKKAKGDL